MENVIVVALKAIIVYNKKALIIKRSFYDDFGAGCWECAGGKLEFGESLTEALQREILEEVGLAVEIGELLYATTFQMDKFRQAVVLTYSCRSNTDKVTLSKEHIDYQWADKKAMQQLLTSGIQQDFENNYIYEKIDIC